MDCSRQISYKRSTKWIFFIMIVVIAFSACEPLRKKFIRKKKKKDLQSTEFIPVLEPIDYPEKVESATSKYKHHYQLWKVYQKDFLTVLDEGGTEKRLKYMISQMILQLGEMKEYLSLEKQKELEVHIHSFEKVLRYIEGTPDVMRNKHLIETKINRIAKKLRRDFTFKKVKDAIEP